MNNGALNILHVLHFVCYQDRSDEEPRLILAPPDRTNARRSWYRGGGGQYIIDFGGGGWGNCMGYDGGVIAISFFSLTWEGGR